MPESSADTAIMISKVVKRPFATFEKIRTAVNASIIKPKTAVVNTVNTVVAGASRFAKSAFDNNPQTASPIHTAATKNEKI